MSSYPKICFLSSCQEGGSPSNYPVNYATLNIICYGNSFILPKICPHNVATKREGFC